MTREVNVDLPEELHRAARVKMAGAGLTWGEVVRRLVEAWVREETETVVTPEREPK